MRIWVIWHLTHRYRAAKPRFFTAVGFTHGWKIWRQALCEHGQTHQTVRTRETGFGPRYFERKGREPRPGITVGVGKRASLGGPVRDQPLTNLTQKAIIDAQKL